MNGEKERLMIFDMIAEGKITAEEAEQLFRAMEVTEEPAPDAPALVPPLSHLSQLTSLSAIPANGPTRSRDLAAALKEAGIDQVTLSDVQELQSNRITAEYIREMIALGLRPGSLSEWIDLRSHGITPRYVRELREIGVTGFDIDELTELKDHGVSAKYIASLHEMGLKGFDLNSVLDLERGAEIARSLRRLYDYMMMELVEANARNNEQRLDGPLRCLGVLREAWREVAAQQQPRLVGTR